MPYATELGVDDVMSIVTNLYQLDGTVHGREYNFLCPVHNDTSASADVNMVTGLWSCWSCGARGDLAHLGVCVLKKLPKSANAREQMEAREEILQLLKPSSGEAIATSVRRKVELARSSTAGGPARKRPYGRLPSPRAYDTRPMTYMRKRGFERDVLKRWKVRYAEQQELTKEDGDKFTITHSIAIPIFNRNGTLQAWCYRATKRSGSWQPKMIYTPGFDLSGNWFGLDHHGDEDEIFVVEGPLDAMWLDQHGIPAIAMMGSGQNNPRKMRLLYGFKKVTLLPDYDHAGVHMAQTLGSHLRGQVPFYVCRWPKAVVRRTGEEKPDPQDIRRPEDLKLVVSRAIPWSAWSLRSNA